MAPPWPAVHEEPPPPFLASMYELMWKCVPLAAHPAGAGGKQQYTVKDSEGRTVKVNFAEKYFGIQTLQNRVPAMKIVKETKSVYIYIYIV